MNDYQEWCKSLIVVASKDKQQIAVLPTKIKEGEEESQSVEILKERVANNLETIKLLREENVRLEQEIEMQRTIAKAPKTPIQKVLAFLNEFRNKWEDDVSLK